jgi:hypothetical protein
MHVPVPLHAPLQPVKVEPDSGMTCRVTTVPVLKLALHVEPQLIPAGFEARMPAPAPFLVTLSEYVLGGDGTANVAVTPWAPFIVTVQVPVPVHAPLQPVKVEPVVAVAFRVTLVLWL